MTKKNNGYLINPACSAVVVFGGHLSAQTVFRLDPEYSGSAIRPCV